MINLSASSMVDQIEMGERKGTMALKQIRKFALTLDYSRGRFGIAFEHSETDKSGLLVSSALEAMALADLLRNSQNAIYDEENKTIETNFRPIGEAMEEWPDLN